MKLIVILSVIACFYKANGFDFHPDIAAFIKQYALRQGFQHLNFIRPLEESNGLSTSPEQPLWRKWLLTSFRNSPTAYVAFHNSCQKTLNASITTKTPSWGCGDEILPFAYYTERRASPPLFVGHLLTAKDLMNLKHVFQSMEHRRSSWLILLSHGMISSINELDLPLDNKAVFAVTSKVEASKSVRVSLWDVYKIASYLPPTTIYLGSWSAKEWRPPRDGLKERILIGSLPDAENSDGKELAELGNAISLKQPQQLPANPLFSREPWERRKDLSGLILRCSTVQESVYVNIAKVSEDGSIQADDIQGLLGEILHIFRRSLNFTLHCFETPDRRWGSLREGKWNGMVGDLVADRADFALADLDLNHARGQAADFPYGWQSEGYMLVFKYIPAFENAGNSYTKEFTWQAWLSIAIFGITMCLSLSLAFRLSPYHDQQPLSEITWQVVAAFCNAGETVSTRRIAPRFLLLVLYLTTMVLHTFYSSFLTSSLTVEMNYLPFTNMKELYEARTHPFRISSGTSLEDQFKLSPIPLHKRIWNEMLMADPSNLSPSNDDLYRYLCKENYVAMVSRSSLIPRTFPCKVVLLPGIYFGSQKSIPFRKDSPLVSTFRIQMMKIVEAGIMDRLEKKLAPKDTDSPDVLGPVGLLQARAAFLLLLFGHITAVFILIIEMICVRWQG
ncbi:probable glutamate receptor [Palaemon carinicauda]|uniref:probable glutamate receptor n=1 Tax=Palaemon carinicauda TaxID=392227 RepID=UPI0035B67E80